MRTSDDAQGPSSAAERPQWGLGPLEVRDPFVLALQRARPWARSPEVLGHLELELAVRGLWANSWAFEAERYRIDAETGEIDLVLRVGLLERFEVGLLLPIEVRGGGVLDGFVEGFHDAFGLPQAGRARAPRDRFFVSGLDERGEPFALEHEGAGLGDLVLEGRALLLEGGATLPALTATARLRLPTGRAAFDLSDGVDVTLGLDASKRLGELPLVLYASLAYTHYAEGRVAGLALERHRAFFALGGEWELHSTLSLVVHAWIESRREVRAFDASELGTDDLSYGNWITYLAAGFKWRPIERLQLEAGMLENLIDPDTTADVAFLLGLRVVL